MKKKKRLLAWECGDELLDKLEGAGREKLRRAISNEVLYALQYHCQTDAIDHVCVYVSKGEVVLDFGLRKCQRRINLRELVADEIEMRGGEDTEEVAGMERLFFDLAEACKLARENKTPPFGLSEPETTEESK